MAQRFFFWFPGLTISRPDSGPRFFGFHLRFGAGAGSGSDSPHGSSSHATLSSVRSVVALVAWSSSQSQESVDSSSDPFACDDVVVGGPAGGVVGYALTSWDEKNKTPIIGYGFAHLSSYCDF